MFDVPPANLVYVLRSSNDPDRHYTGITSDLKRRLAEHNRDSSHHTAKHRPWHPIAAIWLPDPAKARAFERYLKTGSGRAFAKRHF